MSLKTCCVPGCKYNPPSEISFHQFPTKNPDICQEWIDNTGVSSSQITNSSRVCSAHFKREDFITSSGNGIRLRAGLRSNAVPSIFAPLLNEVKVDKENFFNSAQSDTHLIDNKQEIERLKRKLEVANFELESQKLSIKRLTAENEALKNLPNILTRKVMTFDIIKNDGDLIEFYTGFENDAAYSAFLLHIKTRAEKKLPTKLYDDDVISTEDSFFLTLIRLKLGFPAVELARIFGISVASVNCIFKEWINFLSDELRKLLPNLSLKNLIRQKRNKIITESTLMVDCIEIQTSSACGRFNYTGKALVAVTLERSVYFVSCVEGESASFRTIVSKSGFLNYLRAGQSLITDKDSEIADLLPKGVCINNSAPNLNDIIQKVKSNRILDGCMPIAFIDINPILDGCSSSPLTAPTESDPILEGRLPIPLAIWKKSIAVCAMLINFKRA